MPPVQSASAVPVHVTHETTEGSLAMSLPLPSVRRLFFFLAAPKPVPFTLTPASRRHSYTPRQYAMPVALHTDVSTADWWHTPHVPLPGFEPRRAGGILLVATLAGRLFDGCSMPKGLFYPLRWKRTGIE